MCISIIYSEKDVETDPSCSSARHSAVARAAARSNVNHEPFPTPHNTDVVSRTRDSVSSEVSSKNGPRSLIIRGTIANSASEMYSAEPDQTGSAQTHLKEDKNDELLDGLDRGDFERNLSLVGSTSNNSANRLARKRQRPCKNG